MNPWERITALEYEQHMKSIGQYALLNRIFKEQVPMEPERIVTVLGIGCGNGLEHIKPHTIVYGYDINEYFLAACKSRYSNLGFELNLKNIDLTNEEVKVKDCDLLICNLVLEFIDMIHIVRQVKSVSPYRLSFVLQKGKGITRSPYSNKFGGISPLWHEVVPENLITTIEGIDYCMTDSKTYLTDMGMTFIRMDFQKNDVAQYRQKRSHNE